MKRRLMLNKLPRSIYSILSFGANCFRHSPKFAWLYAKRFNGLTKKQTEYCISCLFKKTAGYPLNITNPQTLNEKLQWLNLNYHDPLIQACADKILVRDFIAKTIGAEFLVPILGVYDSADEIDFDSLPDKFVLKVNWGSGQNIICTSKRDFNVVEAKKKLRSWMKPTANHYYDFFEWCYKDIKPRILAEKYIESEGDLPDYKFFCYNGKPLNMFIAQNRNKGDAFLTFTFFSDTFERLPIKQHYKTCDESIVKPQQWENMLQIAQKLSKPFPFVRVDFYIDNGNLKVGELTFCHYAGMIPFEPVEWDYRLGELLELPKPMP